MPLTRVYLPLTPADLTGLAEGRPLGPAPRNAHAVTPALGKPGLVTDEEELEHAAWVAATEEALAGARSRAAAAGHRGGRRRRRHRGAPDLTRRAVARRGRRPPSSAAASCRSTSTRWPGSTEPTDLLWYDVTELADVRALVDQP